MRIRSHLKIRGAHNLRPGHFARLILFALLGSALIFGISGAMRLVAGAGTQQTPPGLPPGQIPPRSQEPPSPEQLELQRKQERNFRKAEYEKTKKMADDLFKKAQSLKATIDKAGEALPLTRTCPRRR